MQIVVIEKPGLTEELIHLSPDDPEWGAAFSGFKDPVMLDRETGETLRYMGTVVERYLGKVHHIRHEFRHRNDPVTGRRRYWQMAATTDFCFRYQMGIFKVVDGN